MTIRALIVAVAIAGLSSCGDGGRRAVPLTAEGQRLGEAHLALIDELTAAARRHHDDCEAMAGALGEVLAGRRDLIAGGATRRAELDAHYQERAIRRMRRLLPFLYACADNPAVRETVVAMQRGDS